MSDLGSLELLACYAHFFQLLEKLDISSCHSSATSVFSPPAPMCHIHIHPIPRFRQDLAEFKSGLTRNYFYVL